MTTQRWDIRHETPTYRLVFCLSLANVIMLPFWGRMFIYGTAFDETFQNAFHMGEYDRLDLLAAMLVVLILAGFLFAWCRISVRRRSSLLHRAETVLTAGLILIGMGLTPWGHFIGGASNSPYLPVWALAAAVAFLIGAAIVRPSWLATGVRSFVMIASPAILLTFGNATVGAYALTPEEANVFSLRDLARPVSRSRASQRVVWIVFDELDQRLTFEATPPDLSLPSFRRLKQEGFYATRAVPPFWHTYNSVTSLLTGGPVREIRIRADSMKVRYKGMDGFQPFLSADNVFVRAREAGAASAAFGQLAFSYCTLLRDFLNRCWSLDGWWLGGSDTVLSRLLKIARDARRLIVRTLNRRSNETDFRLRQIERTRRLGDDLVATVADPRVDFIYAHLSLPHEPFIYNHRTNRFDPRVGPVAGYFGNLKLTDNMLGRILRTLDESKIGQKTAVIVTGDHWWRSSKNYDGVIDKRVPFLVRLPGQTRRYRHEAPFPTLKAGDLVMALLQGRVARAENIPSIMGNGR